MYGAMSRHNRARLTKELFDDLRSQIVTSSRGGRRYPPCAFTALDAAIWESLEGLGYGE